MNVFFQSKYRYIVHDSTGNIQTEMRSLINTKWYDFSNNIMGTVSDDGSFKLYPKLSFTIDVFGTPTSIAVIDGKLEGDDNKTIINSVIRPTYSITLAFYIILFILFAELLDLQAARTTTFEYLSKSIAILVILIVLFGLIKFAVYRLKRRFEKLLNLSH